jgi:hypothetical protein
MTMSDEPDKSPGKPKRSRKATAGEPESAREVPSKEVSDDTDSSVENPEALEDKDEIQVPGPEQTREESKTESAAEDTGTETTGQAGRMRFRRNRPRR